jgi:hypothetical protein
VAPSIVRGFWLALATLPLACPAKRPLGSSALAPSPPSGSASAPVPIASSSSPSANVAPAAAWTFDAEPTGATSLVDYAPGLGERWDVRADADAPSKSNVLAGTAGPYGISVAVFGASPIGASRVSLRCKMVSSVKAAVYSENPPTCGVVIRDNSSRPDLKYDNDLVLVTAGAKPSVILVRTLDSSSTLLTRRPIVDAEIGAWHELVVVDRADHVIEVEWDGAPVLSFAEPSLPPGKVGVATNGVAYFDDVRVFAR